jgi:hypothetical protein
MSAMNRLVESTTTSLDEQEILVVSPFGPFYLVVLCRGNYPWSLGPASQTVRWGKSPWSLGHISLLGVADTLTLKEPTPSRTPQYRAWDRAWQNLIGEVEHVRRKPLEWILRLALDWLAINSWAHLTMPEHTSRSAAHLWPIELDLSAYTSHRHYTTGCAEPHAMEARGRCS